MYCVQTSALTHRFGRQAPMLNEVALQVPLGSIYGFLGPNGAGKTTTLRLLLGLLKKQHGSIHLFGLPLQQHRRAVLTKTGSLIESPSVYAHLSAAENLEVWQRIYRCPKDRIRKVLQLTGLSHTGNRKAGQFSLGMKQRLGIATAMLHQPQLLILDEPTNGLDPHGIIEMRELLQTLNRQEGTTILISSHLLPEIEKLATDFGIINKGRMVFQGKKGALSRLVNTSAMVSFDTDNPVAAQQLLIKHATNVTLEQGKISLPFSSPDNIAGINQLLVQEGIRVYGIHHQQHDLESTFTQLINQ